MDTRKKTYGYYHLHIATPGGKNLLQSNNERAYIMSQLQDILNPHFVFTDVPLRLQLAPTIDLLAFHIGVKSIELLVFAIDKTASHYLALTLLRRLEEYRNDYCIQGPTREADAMIAVYLLEGVHNALIQSLAIHRMSIHWESDRYSSVGFYLYDRRGDWMRTWRLAQLYDNISAEYLRMLHTRKELASKQAVKIPQSSYRRAPLLRAL